MLQDVSLQTFRDFLVPKLTTFEVARHGLCDYMQNLKNSLPEFDGDDTHATFRAKLAEASSTVAEFYPIFSRFFARYRDIANGAIDVFENKVKSEVMTNDLIREAMADPARYSQKLLDKQQDVATRAAVIESEEARREFCKREMKGWPPMEEVHACLGHTLSEHWTPVLTKELAHAGGFDAEQISALARCKAGLEADDLLVQKMWQEFQHITLGGSSSLELLQILILVYCMFSEHERGEEEHEKEEEEHEERFPFLAVAVVSYAKYAPFFVTVPHLDIDDTEHWFEIKLVHTARGWEVRAFLPYELASARWPRLDYESAMQVFEENAKKRRAMRELGEQFKNALKISDVAKI